MWDRKVSGFTELVDKQRFYCIVIKKLKLRKQGGECVVSQSQCACLGESL